MGQSLNVRELYCPGHFGNSYEVALPREMGQILAEARFWGFNRYSDWFDTIDLYDVYRKTHRLYNMPEAIWERKFANYAAAQACGMELGLGITPNHVFSNQVTPQNEATKDSHTFGQLVCPSRPGVTEMILDNYRNLFNDFTARGLRLRSLSACPYDYGGCACESCRPWIVTFGKLYRPIAELAGEIFGKVETNLLGWWWKDEEHTQFAEWADREAPNFFHSLAFHLPYGTTDYKLRALPRQVKERAFVHIGYGEMSNRDNYGHYGPPIAPTRIESTVRYLFARGAEGFQAYSEGIYDEINKALLAGLTSGQFESADAVLGEYARRHLGGQAEGWRRWLRMMGDAFSIDVKQARPLFDQLKKHATAGWRLEQLEGRLMMAEADAAVRAESDWTPQRLAAAEAFWQVKEKLYRDVWRLGLTRHIFRFEGNAPKWHEEYQKVLGGKVEQPTTLKAEA